MRRRRRSISYHCQQSVNKTRSSNRREEAEERKKNM